MMVIKTNNLRGRLTKDKRNGKWRLFYNTEDVWLDDVLKDFEEEEVRINISTGYFNEDD